MTTWLMGHFENTCTTPRTHHCRGSRGWRSASAPPVGCITCTRVQSKPSSTAMSRPPTFCWMTSGLPRFPTSGCPRPVQTWTTPM
uniref:Uncharacterized protein n=1 Tax=Oryza sativa subsp. japonica TaxID=39947 RepID=Q5W6V6_ORYSJ|nr:unknown protein [Oryza sativa Japonica Group]